MFPACTLGNYNQNIKTAAILAAILDCGYLQKSKHVNNVSGRFLIPQNICLDTLLVVLVCMVRKLWSKYENGSHFGRHFGFWRMPTGDFSGLFISDSTHIPEPILKKSACYQKCSPFGLYELNYWAIRYYNLYEWIRLGLYNNSLIFCDTYMSVPHWSRPTINRPK